MLSTNCRIDFGPPDPSPKYSYDDVIDLKPLSQPKRVDAIIIRRWGNQHLRKIWFEIPPESGNSTVHVCRIPKGSVAICDDVEGCIKIWTESFVIKKIGE